jgi:outer membrane receptor protein involved in Fe transport
VRRLSQILAGGLLLVTTATAGASHAWAVQSRELSLPAGRLGDAIVALGRQAGVSIGVSDPVLAGRGVPAVRGRLSVEQALQRMLANTDARVVRVGPGSYRIVRHPPRPEIRIARRAPERPPGILAAAPMPAEEQSVLVVGARRPMLLSAYPGGVEIVDGDDPELANGPRGSEALIARLPGLASTHLGPGRNKLFIRGIADSSFSGPTQATAGQYLGETRLNYNAPDPDLRLFDIDRVEILEGPQGTLYGAGSLGGVIRVMPNRPRTDAVAGMLSIGATATGHGDPGGDLAAMLNLPIIEGRLGLRLVGYTAQDGGYIDDTLRGLDDVNRVRTIGGRAALRLETEDGWTFDLGASGQRIRGRDGQYADRDAPPLTRESAIAQPFGTDYLLADLVVSKDWGRTRFTTAFGWVHHDISELYDSTIFNLPPQFFAQRTNITLLSAESRLSGQTGGGFAWVIGTSIISNDSEQRRSAGPVASPIQLAGVSNGIKELAVFGEASLPITPTLTLTAGARFSLSRLSGSALDAPARVLEPLFGTSAASRDESAFLPSLAIAWEARPRLLLFARYQESFRPGGLAVESAIFVTNQAGLPTDTLVATADTAIRRFRNDNLSALEAGLRYGRSGAGAFDVSASVAYTRWQDIQADTVSLSGFPTTANIGDGRIYSFEIRAGWRPLPGLSLEVSALANDSRVVDPFPGIFTAPAVPLSSATRIVGPHAPLPNVADISARGAVDYQMALAPDLALRLNASIRYVGASVLGVGPILGEKQGEVTDISLGARLEHGAHAFTLSATNLLDEAGNRFAMGSPFTLIANPQVTPLRPRSIRIGWQFAF